MYSGLRLFKTAFINTRRQIVVSGVFLVAITCVLTFILYLAESRVDPNFGFWDAFIWPYEKYLGDPGKIVDEPLLSPVGKIIGTLVGIMGVAIFAVPAGLIGSGLTDAMDEEKRQQELQELRVRVRKAFLRDNNKVLGNYLQKHPDGKLGDKDLFFVPQEIPVYKMQARQNMDLKDIIDCCKEFPEIRLKNVAQAKAEADARFVVEYVPLKDACYGYFINRHSKVTIVSTSSYAEKGTGWFAYYLAKLGGFNYLSKDLEVDYDDQDPYFNMNVEPLHDMKNQTWHEKLGNREAIEKIQKKQEYRDAFISNLTSCCVGEHSWVIIIKHHLKSTADSYDFHFNCAKKDGKECTVSDLQTYEQLIADFTQTMAHEEVAGEELGLTTTSASPLYPLKHNERQKNLAYFIRERKPQANVFVLRPASDVMNLDERKLVIAYRMAQLISQHLDNGQGPKENDVKDLQQLDFAFTETANNAKAD